MKRFLFFILSLLYLITSNAQHFTELNVVDFPLNKELPRFVQQHQLGLNETSDDYEVKIEFPVYQALTNDEVKALERYEITLPNAITFSVSYGIDRKRLVADISVLPFLNHQGTPVRLTSFLIKFNKKGGEYALTKKSRTQTVKSQRYADNSVLSSGKWVKIKVKKEGIYELNQSLIQKWGFSDLKKIKVYGYGGLIQPQTLDYSGKNAPIDDLCEVNTFRTEQKILFFAEGTTKFTWQTSRRRWEHENNPYSDASYYFVTESNDAPSTMPTLENVTETTPITSISYSTVYDEDCYAWYEGGRQFHDAYDFANGNSKTYTIATPSANSEPGSIFYAIAASNQTASTQVEVLYANELLERTSIRRIADNESAIEIKKTCTITNVQPKTQIKFQTTNGHHARLNFILVNYQRELIATDAPFSFVVSPTSNSVSTLKIKNASKHTQVWHIAHHNNTISNVPTRLEGTDLYASVEHPKDRYVIVNTNVNYASPELAEHIENQNLHADRDYDMVIVTPASGIFDKQAQLLADAHRNSADSLSVKVVRQNQIFNEFGSGTPDATAIRRYLKMLYDKANTKSEMPKYLLLFGDCSFDNRMLTDNWKNKSASNYLLAYEDNDNYATSQTTSIGDLMSYPSDDYFGLLDDGEGGALKTEKVDLAIGRFVCHTVEHANVLVNKTINYLQNKNTGNWKNKIVIIGDSKDKNIHMEDAEKVAQTTQTLSNNHLNVKRIYPDLYDIQVTGVGYRFPKANEVLKDEIKRGALIFNYSGHGSPAQISHAFILETKDWDNLESSALPLWILASCEILPYDQNTSDFARTALFSPRGGGVAFMCASRAVYASENNKLNLAYTKYLLSLNKDGSQNSIGEALRLAKNELINNGTDRSINKLKYILAGDPALPLMLPKEEVRLDSINGQAIEQNSNVQLKAGSIATFSGSIPFGFSGKISATLYDKVEQFTCKNNEGKASAPFKYQERTKVIFEGTDSVVNGKFAFKVPIPKDISYSQDKGRISFYAVSSDSQIEANGMSETFHFNGTDASITSTDSVGPQAFIYLNSPDFPNGGITDSNPTFIAILNDSSGINATGISLGHDIELNLDNEISKTFILNDYFSYDFGTYQQGTVNYTLKNIPEGKHQLTFRVWDLNNNATTRTLNFTVNNAFISQNRLYATLNPASTHTQFVAQVATEHIGGVAKFEVYNLLGKLLWSTSKTVESTSVAQSWNLTTLSASPASTGVYLYRVVIESANGCETYDAQRLIVI